MKYDKMRFGDLKVGFDAPDIEIIDLNGNKVHLFDFLEYNTPFVLIGGVQKKIIIIKNL